MELVDRLQRILDHDLPMIAESLIALLVALIALRLLMALVRSLVH